MTTEKEKSSNLETLRPAIRVAFITREGKILLVEHQNGFWILPGGGSNPEEIKEGENILTPLNSQTLRRELTEEISLTETQMKILNKRNCQCPVSATEWVNQQGQHRIDFVWAVYLGSLNLCLQPDHEVTRLHWTDLYHPVVPQGIITQNTQDAVLATRLVLAGKHPPGAFFSPSFNKTT